METCHRFLFLVSTLVFLVEGRVSNDQVCSPISKASGLLPPIWPIDYAVQFERVEGNLVKQLGVYTDFQKNRLAFHQFHNGMWVRKILDFDLDQCITIEQEDTTKDLASVGHGHKCTITKVSACDLTFGLHQSDFMKYLVKKEFLYDQRLDYKNATERRGILVDIFDGCLTYNTASGTEERFKTEYAFTENVVAPPSGIKGSVPVSVVASGKNETKYQSYYWFDSMRPMYQDYFYIPEGSYCEGYARVKPLPDKLFKMFKVRSQVVQDKYKFIENKETLVQSISNHYEIFSSKLLLKRVDFVVTDEPLLEGKYVYNRISLIYDMSNNVSFVVNSVTKHCDMYYNKNLMEEIGSTRFKFFDSFVFKKLDLTKAHYKGLGPCDDFICEIWTTSITEPFPYRDGNVTAFADVYFLTGWAKTVASGTEDVTPLQITTYLNFSLDAEGVADKISVKLFDFDDSEPNILDFDIHTCMDQHNKIYAHITFKGVDEFKAEDLRRSVEDSFVAETSLVTGLPALSIQDIRVLYHVSQKSFDVLFSLTDYGLDFPRAADALKTMNDTVTSGFFIISVVVEEKENVFVAVSSSLSLQFPSADSASKTMEMVEDLGEVSENEATGEATSEAPKEDKEKHYSSGDLAGVIVSMMLLGIILGCACTISICKYNAHLFSKMKSGSHHIEVIALTS